jgi:hypothetical protein
MTASPTTRPNGTVTLNHLRIGAIYRAVTHHGVAVGEFLGIETPHGDRAILLRHRTGTDSIEVGDMTAIHAVAA